MYRHILAFFAVICLLAAASPASAVIIGKDKTLGAGIGSGSFANQATGKMYLSETHAVQAFVGLSTIGIHANADYVVEFGQIIDKPWGRFFWGLGAGVGAVMYSSGGATANLFTVNGVGQVGFHLKKLPIEAIVDIRPTYYLNSGSYLNAFQYGYGGGAVRWYF